MQVYLCVLLLPLRFSLMASAFRCFPYFQLRLLFFLLFFLLSFQYKIINQRLYKKFSKLFWILFLTFHSRVEVEIFQNLSYFSDCLFTFFLLVKDSLLIRRQKEHTHPPLHLYIIYTLRDLFIYTVFSLNVYIGGGITHNIWLVGAINPKHKINNDSYFLCFMAIDS